MDSDHVRHVWSSLTQIRSAAKPSTAVMTACPPTVVRSREEIMSKHELNDQRKQRGSGKLLGGPKEVEDISAINSVDFAETQSELPQIVPD